ncbi:MAG TPA: aspartate kinase [Candidatus Dormibacteraeota bacterium]|nr:aspartate kinase [Candidatus Dormibacteraeota bacterium]
MDALEGPAAQETVDSDLAFGPQVGEADEERLTLCESPRANGMTVLKFGGSSLAGAERLLRSASIVQQAAAEQTVAVVVSAMRGITDQLFMLTRHLRDGARGLATNQAQGIISLHQGVAQDLNVRAQDAARLREEIDHLGRDLLHEVNREYVNRGYDDVPGLETMDRIVSFGERLSCRLMTATLRQLGTNALAVEASDFLVTSDDFQSARPQLDVTVVRAGEIFPTLFAQGVVPVVTGFLGATLDGRITTLGRNSSDFSAAIVAHALGASELVIWTDVDGMYTANPHQSASARLLPELSYTSAQALAASGAKVLHHDVIPLAAKTQMRVAIRNTLNPQARGTLIGPHSEGAQ